MKLYITLLFAFLALSIAQDTCEVVTVGNTEGPATAEDWGEFNDDGTISFTSEAGVSGTIAAFLPDDSPQNLAIVDGGLGDEKEGKSKEIDAGEYITVTLEGDDCYFDAYVGFGSLLGHFVEGTKWDASVQWEAYLEGELVNSGEVIQDGNNSDGDDDKTTAEAFIKGQFDYLVFKTYSETGNSNYILNYVSFSVASESIVFIGGQSVEDWGEVQEDGSIDVSNDFVVGSVYATKDGNPAEIVTAHDGLGIKGTNDEINRGEVITLDFTENNVALYGATVVVDSLYGHFDEGSKQDAKVQWYVYLQGELVDFDETYNDDENADGDDKQETASIFIAKEFDKVEVTMDSNNKNSNFVVSSIEFKTSCEICDSFYPATTAQL